MTLGLIWAQTPAGVIGRGGAIPWHLPEDLAHFREVTAGHAVVMGRATWQSLPDRFRPLPGRENVVLSRDPGFVAPGARVVGTLGAALGLGYDEAWVVGGAAVYSAAMPLADRLEVTEVDLDVAGDTYAPKVVPGDWAPALVGPWQTSRTGLRYRFLGYSSRNVRGNQR